MKGHLTSMPPIADWIAEALVEEAVDPVSRVQAVLAAESKGLLRRVLALAGAVRGLQAGIPDAAASIAHLGHRVGLLAEVNGLTEVSSAVSVILRAAAGGVDAEVERATCRLVELARQATPLGGQLPPTQVGMTSPVGQSSPQELAA